jgi:hypothetical protein
MADTRIRKEQIGSGAATDGQVLTADGSGNTAWEDAPAGGTVVAGDIDTEAATDGQVLTSDGAGNAAWENPPAGGTVDAGDVTYTPAVAADWDSDADPGDVDNALDQLAERTDDLEAASHTPVTLGAGNDAALALTGQELTLTLPAGGLDATGIDATFVPTSNGDDTWDWAAPTGGSADPADIILTDTYANRPAAGTAGRIFLPSDGVYLERDTGAAWAPWGPIYPMTPPVSGDFAWINQGTASIDTTLGGIYLLAPATAGFCYRIRKKAVPSAPYTVTACFLVHCNNKNYNRVGLVLRQSSDGKIFGFFAGNNDGLGTQNGNSATSWNANLNSLTISLVFPVIWMRIVDDNTNRKCYYSFNGDARDQYFHLFESRSRTDFLTPDEIGFFACSENDTYAAAMTLLSWKEA